MHKVESIICSTENLPISTLEPQSREVHHCISLPWKVAITGRRSAVTDYMLAEHSLPFTWHSILLDANKLPARLSSQKAKVEMTYKKL